MPTATSGRPWLRTRISLLTRATAFAMSSTLKITSPNSTGVANSLILCAILNIGCPPPHLKDWTSRLRHIGFHYAPAEDRGNATSGTQEGDAGPAGERHAGFPQEAGKRNRAAMPGRNAPVTLPRRA